MPNSRTPTAKRSPSILVTDVRSQSSKGRSAPFAGGRRALKQGNGSKPRTRFSDISVTNILFNSNNLSTGRSRNASDIAGNQGRYAPHGSYMDQLASQRFQPGRRPTAQKKMMTQKFPQRTSKTSQKLVYIPENDSLDTFDDNDDNDDNRNESESETGESNKQTSRSSLNHPTSKKQVRSPAERAPKDQRASFPRVTAYCISEGFKLKPVTDFLRDNHVVKPRLYDEALYVPYYLPLLPGSNGCRIKSNTSIKNSKGKTLMETMIDRSEQGDHHYEYYSAVEINNNQVVKPTDSIEDWATNNPQNAFDPSEPQYFSPRSSPLMVYPSNSEVKPEHSNSSPKTYSDTTTQVQPTISIIEDSRTESNNSIPSIELPVPDMTKHAELFIFSYGVIVLWNFTENQEKEILADLTFARYSSPSGDPVSLVSRPFNEDEIETEEFHFQYSKEIRRPRIYNDMITLKSGDHVIKLAMSHSIAQSTKLCSFEERMSIQMNDVQKLPKRLALTGKLGMNREQVLKLSGKLFKLRVDVNLSSNVLDTPDIFWDSEPSLNPLYTATREYLEINQRVKALNERCKVFLDLTEIISDSIAETNMSRITWILITLFVVSVLVTSLEIAIRYFIIKNLKR